MTTSWKGGAAAALMGMAMLASPAQAQEKPGKDAEIAIEIVSYGDLDLSTAQDRRELRDRLRKAAHHVCGMDIIGVASRFASPEARKCYAKQMARLDSEVAARAALQARRP